LKLRVFAAPENIPGHPINCINRFFGADDDGADGRRLMEINFVVEFGGPGLSVNRERNEKGRD
jgi:hypothetical protein